MGNEKSLTENHLDYSKQKSASFHDERRQKTRMGTENVCTAQPTEWTKMRKESTECCRVGELTDSVQFQEIEKKRTFSLRFKLFQYKQI